MLRTTSLLIALGVVFAVFGCSGGASNEIADSSSASNMSSTSSDSAAMTESTNPEPAVSDSVAPTTASFETDAKPIIATKCIGCHSGAAPKGGLDFSLLATNADATAKADWLKKMSDEVTAGKMPPSKGAPLTEEEKTKLLAALNAVGG